MSDQQQEAVDAYYWRNGPCCAGCDWWRWIATTAGECTKAAPVSGHERAALLGMRGCSGITEAGWPLTLSKDGCGDFRDTFDWTTLPLAYRRRVGCPA